MRGRSISRLLRRKYILIVSAMSVMVFVIASSRMLPSLFRNYYFTVKSYSYEFLDNKFDAKNILQSEGIVAGKYGLVVPPHAQGYITIPLRKSQHDSIVLKMYSLRDDHVKLVLDKYGKKRGVGLDQITQFLIGVKKTSHVEDHIRTTIDISSDGGRSYETILTDFSRTGEGIGTPVDLTKYVKTDAPSSVLRFHAENPTDKPETVLQYMAISIIPPNYPFPSKNLSDMLYLLVFMIFLFLLMKEFITKEFLAFVVWLPIYLILSLSLTVHEYDTIYESKILYWSLMAIFFIRCIFDKRRSKKLAFYTVLAMTSILLYAYELRWEHLVTKSDIPISPDAKLFMGYAHTLEGMYRQEGILSAFYLGDFHYREPFFILLTKTLFGIFGRSEINMMFLSLVFSMAMVYGAYKIGKEGVHPFIGLVSAGLISLNSICIENSNQGLREEFSTTILLTYFYILFIGKKLTPWVKPISSSALGAILVLTRSETIILVIILLSLGIIAQKWEFKKAIVCIVLMAIVIFPRYYGWYKIYRDPFFPSSFQSRVNANLEFQGYLGMPGFATREEFDRGWWGAGSKISSIEYVFGYHSLRQIITYVFRGYYRIFYHVIFDDNPLMAGLFILGMLSLYFSPQWIFSVFLIVAFAPPYSFLAGVEKHFDMIFPYRYVIHGIPMTYVVCVYPIFRVSERIWEMRDHYHKRKDKLINVFLKGVRVEEKRVYALKIFIPTIIFLFLLTISIVMKLITGSTLPSYE